MTPKQAEKIAIAMEIGSLSLSLHSIAIEEPEVDVLIRKASFAPADAARRVEPADPKSYTGEIDVLHMIGEPYGLPHPGRSSSGGTGRGVNVLRGSEAQQVRN